MAGVVGEIALIDDDKTKWRVVIENFKELGRSDKEAKEKRDQDLKRSIDTQYELIKDVIDNLIKIYLLIFYNLYSIIIFKFKIWKNEEKKMMNICFQELTRQFVHGYLRVSDTTSDMEKKSIDKCISDYGKG